MLEELYDTAEYRQLYNFAEVEMHELNAQMQTAITTAAKQRGITVTGISVTASETDSTPKLIAHYDNGSGNEYGGMLEIPVFMATPTFTIKGISPKI